jgi:hypothetical protein
MVQFLVGIGVMAIAFCARAQAGEPATVLVSPQVAAAVLGAIITAGLGAIGYASREVLFKTRLRRANRQVFDFLYAMLAPLRDDASADWFQQWGLYYRNQLSSEIIRLARDKRELLSGGVFFDLIRLSAALRSFSFDRSHPDSGTYSIDELIADTCGTLKRIVPFTTRAEFERNRELNKLEETQRLMKLGLSPGGFKPMKAPPPDAATNPGRYDEG